MNTTSFQCSSGVFQRFYRANDLETFKGDYSIPIDGWEVQPIVTLIDAASKQSPSDTFAANKCNCKVISQSNRSVH